MQPRMWTVSKLSSYVMDASDHSFKVLQLISHPHFVFVVKPQAWEKLERLRALEEDEKNKKFLFLTEEDILSLRCFQNQTLIAIKAPQASYIEVIDPDDEEDTCFPQNQFRMIVRSTIGPIHLYLLRDRGVNLLQDHEFFNQFQFPSRFPDQITRTPTFNW
ncbi:unnamed protein product [Prunus armeniaca]|uniref:E2F transcription factor CC-MB domain-containing protein n=1 Tax=Prunus armeniaca TaxID=36596 RepID=A0A6J5U3G7_PRUAR|nr:unnamed protein product [Prunus armeniaca]